MYELANLCYSAARGGKQSEHQHTPPHLCAQTGASRAFRAFGHGICPASVRSDVLRRTQTYSDVLYILLPSSGTPASVRSDVLRRTPAEFWNTRICALRRAPVELSSSFPSVLAPPSAKRQAPFSILSAETEREESIIRQGLHSYNTYMHFHLPPQHLCAQTGASRAFVELSSSFPSVLAPPSAKR